MISAPPQQAGAQVKKEASAPWLKIIKNAFVLNMTLDDLADIKLDTFYKICSAYVNKAGNEPIIRDATQVDINRIFGG